MCIPALQAIQVVGNRIKAKEQQRLDTEQGAAFLFVSACASMQRIEAMKLGNSQKKKVGQHDFVSRGFEVHVCCILRTRPPSLPTRCRTGGSCFLFISR